MRRSTVVTLVAGLLVVNACGSGSGDDTSDPTSPPTPPTSEVEPAAPSSTEPAPTAPATSPPTAPTTQPPPTTEPAPPEQVVVSSDDGDLTISLSPDDAERVQPSIRLLAPDEYPAELAGAEQLPGVKLYELEPDGASFDEPVTVTRRLDAANLELADEEVPLVSLITQDDDGNYEMLAELASLRVGDDVYVSGTTTHFSPLISTNERSPVALTALDLEDTSLGGEVDLTALVRRIPGVVIDDRRIGTVVTLRSDDPTTPPRFDVRGVPTTWNPVTDGGGTATFEPPVIRSGGTSISDAYPWVLDQAYAVPAAAFPSAIQLGAVDRDATFTYRFGRLVVTSDRAAPTAPAAPVADDGLSALRDAFHQSFPYGVSVIHNDFDPFPSYEMRTYGLPEIPAGWYGYSALIDGDPYAQGRVVSVGELQPGDGGLQVESGIECYCPYRDVLVFSDTPMPLDAFAPGGTDAFWVFAAAQTDVGITVTVTDTETGDVLVHEVGPAEGPLYDDLAAFATVP